jgi:hypothetical protein
LDNHRYGAAFAVDDAAVVCQFDLTIVQATVLHSGALTCVVPEHGGGYVFFTKFCFNPIQLLFCFFAHSLFPFRVANAAEHDAWSASGQFRIESDENVPILRDIKPVSELCVVVVF